VATSVAHENLLDEGLLHGVAPSTGETMLKTRADVKPYPRAQTIIPNRLTSPSKKTSPLVSFRGKPCSHRRGRKESGKKGLHSSSKPSFLKVKTRAESYAQRHRETRPCPSSSAMKDPSAAPVCARSPPTSAIHGKDWGKQFASSPMAVSAGGSHGFVVAHVTPEARTSAAPSPS